MHTPLGMKINDEGAFAQLVRGKVKQPRIGRINDVYFAETMSFGLDKLLQPTPQSAAQTTPLPRRGSTFLTSGLSLWLRVTRVTLHRFVDGERTLIFKRLSWPSRLALHMAVALRSVRMRNLTITFLQSATTIKKYLSFLTCWLAGAGKHVNSRIVRDATSEASSGHFHKPVPIQVDGEGSLLQNSLSLRLFLCFP